MDYRIQERVREKGLHLAHGALMFITSLALLVLEAEVWKRLQQALLGPTADLMGGGPNTSNTTT